MLSDDTLRYSPCLRASNHRGRSVAKRTKKGVLATLLIKEV
jgi:hypothetical protein